ncbi:MAG: BRCT domain-containing protein, partial [Patescibacteria group bacterium]
MPTACPADGARVVREGALYRCSNPMCGARHRESLSHFVARGAFNIMGLGPKIIDRFLDEGLVVDAADLFTLRAGDIAVLEGFGEKSAENLVGEIALRKSVSLDRFLFSLGVLHVGAETARALAKQRTTSNQPLTTPRSVLRAFQKLSAEDLREVPDIGPAVSESIYRWFRDPRHARFLERLTAAGVRIVPPRAQKAGRFAGKTFVITGTLAGMDRETAKERIRARGGNTSESVSKRTAYVVIGEHPGSKYEKAKALGITVLTEQEFARLIRG